MPDYAQEIAASSIVMLGSFNPAIFQPEWFLRQELLPQGEADKADLQIVHPQMTSFETERFLIQVTPERFNAATKPNTIHGPLRDLVLGTFFVLGHTPVTALGLNCILHFRMNSEKAWHRLGDRLAPKEPWAEVLEGHPGLISLDIQAQRQDSDGSNVMVRVQPSVLVKPGVYFEINSHHPAKAGSGLKELMQVLQSDWDEVQRKGETIARHILDWSAS
jgi:hypothetical protein